LAYNKKSPEIKVGVLYYRVLINAIVLFPARGKQLNAIEGSGG
jgi:hypothetical protein